MEGRFGKFRKFCFRHNICLTQNTSKKNIFFRFQVTPSISPNKNLLGIPSTVVLVYIIEYLLRFIIKKLKLYYIQL